MAILDFFKRKTMSSSMNYSMGVKDLVRQSFKGDVQRTTNKLNDGIGEEHPFDFRVTEGVYKKFGFVTGMLDKVVDFVWGPGFFTICKNERAKKIVDDWMSDVNFDSHGRRWLLEALVKGTGFLELGGGIDEQPQGVKVLNANRMFIKRSNKGVVNGYSQVKAVDENNLRTIKSTDVNTFQAFQIAHFTINQIGDCAYGLGRISPSLNTLDNLFQLQKDMHTLMSRKANSPIIATLGDRSTGEIPTAQDVSNFAGELQYLNDKTEWVIPDSVRMSMLDFGSIGDKFESPIQHDMNLLYGAFQTPAVLVGNGNIPEGLAKVQMDAFQRMITSIQVELEKVIENKIFTRILQANGMDAHVEFEWGQPSQEEKDIEINQLTELLKNPALDPELRRQLEIKLAGLMGLNPEDILSSQEEREKEEDQAQPIVPGQNGNETPEDQQKVHHIHESIDQDYDLTEWLGFNFQKYLRSIKNVIDKDPFSFLAATTQEELEAGLFDEGQVRKMKKVLKSGFEKGDSMNTIASNIGKEVRPGDRFQTKDGKIVLSSEGTAILQVTEANRTMLIARSETTRLANLGSQKEYKDGGVEEYRWVATLSDRTCPVCNELNGEIFPINNGKLPPAHQMCRCTITPITELESV